MSDPHGDELDADRLGGLLQELSDRLANVGEHAQLFVVGGAAGTGHPTPRAVRSRTTPTRTPSHLLLRRLRSGP